MYSIQQPTYGRHKVSHKFNQSEVTQKVRKIEGSFLHGTHHLEFMHIAIKLIIKIFHIFYLNMACIRIV